MRMTAPATNSQPSSTTLTAFILSESARGSLLRRGRFDLDLELRKRQPRYPDERHRREILTEELRHRAIGGK
jgi:hypothetical protein